MYEYEYIHIYMYIFLGAAARAVAPKCIGLEAQDLGINRVEHKGPGSVNFWEENGRVGEK